MHVYAGICVFLHIHAGQLAMNIVVTYSTFDDDDDAVTLLYSIQIGLAAMV